MIITILAEAATWPEAAQNIAGAVAGAVGLYAFFKFLGGGWHK